MTLAAILVVSSDASWRKGIADRLLLASYLVYCALDTDEAAGLLRDGLAVMVVVVDACSPDLEGFRWERSRDARLHSIPVVAIVHGSREIDLHVAVDHTWAVSPNSRLEATVERMLAFASGGNAKA